MYEILVVDDEAVEREVVRFLLKKYGFPVTVTEAANGREALELLRQKQFHVLFTDIQMPFLNGLELARQARELAPELHIIFFSGFDDFEYARQALSLRVIDYILKPVEPDKFRATISGVIEQLRTREQAAREKAETRAVIRRHVLRQLLSGVSPEQLTALYPQWDISFLWAYHQLFLIQLFQRDDSTGALFPSDMVTELLPEHCHCVNLKPGLSLVLLFGQRHQEKWYRDLTDQITGHIRKSFLTDSIIALSRSFDKPEEIYSVYLETEQTLRENAFFLAEKSPASEEEGFSSNEAMVSQLTTDIRLKDQKSIQQHIEAFLDSFRRQQPHSHIYIRYLCTNIVKVLLDALTACPEEAFDPYARKIWDGSFSDIEKLLRELSEKLVCQLENESQFQNHGISMVKQYIRKHYAEGLSLDILAEKVHLSPRYLSSLFMEEEGIGINRYIKEIRMTKARELLLETNLKVTDICTQVGYSNLSYFCKSFSDHYGVTPDKFRTLTSKGKGEGHE